MKSCSSPLRAIFLCLSLLVFNCFESLAQDLDDVTISGKITDSNGAALPGATITAFLISTGQERAAITNEEGRYRLIELPPGAYLLRVAAIGFQTVEQKDLNTVAGQNLQLNYRLAPATVKAETVVVDESAAPSIDTARTVVGSTITEREIIELPNLNRSPFDLIFTLAGVTEEPFSTRDLSADRGGRNENAQPGTPEEAGIFALSGGAAYSNNLTIDGLDNNDDRAATFRFEPSIETIAEVQVITNQFSAEYGRASGGRVNLRTKSGTTDFRGRLFYFFRDESLNANTNSNKARGIARPAVQENNPGFTFGGPVPVAYFKNKTFFFAGYEYADIDENTIIDTLVPVVQNSRFPLPAPTNQDFVFVDDGTGIASYVAGVRTPLRTHTLTARLDHKFSDSHNVTAGFQFGRRRDFRQFSGGNRLAESLFGASRTSDAYNFTDNYVFGSKIVNQFRFQWSTLKPLAIADGDQSNPVVLTSLPARLGYGSSLVAGTSTLGASDRRENRWQFQESLSYLAGSHSLRLGFDVQRVSSVYVDRTDATGTFRFFSANAFATTKIDRFNQTFGNESAQRNVYWGVFAQDEWRAGDKLTVNFGLRYERETIIADKNNFAPRASVAYAPFDRGKTVIRAGFGMFYNRALLRTIDDYSLGASQIEFDTNQIPRALQQAVLDQLNERFPQTLTADDPLVRQYGLTNTDFSRRLDPNLRIPESYQTNVGFEHEISKGLVFEANLTVNKTAFLWREFNANAPRLPAGFRDFAEYLLSRDFANLPGADGRRPLFGGQTSTSANYIRFITAPFNTNAPGAQSALSGNPDLGGIICINGAAACANQTGNPNPNRYYLINLASITATNTSAPIAAALAAINNLRPDPSREQLEQLASIGNSNYRALTLELRKRYAKLGAGFNWIFRVAYTLSSLKDDGAVNTSSAQIAGDFTGEYARSSLDRRHRLALSGTIGAPAWLGKLSFSPIVRLASGAPFSLSGGGIDRNLDDVNTDRPSFSGNIRDIHWRTVREPFPQNVFNSLSLPLIGSRGGNLPRNAGRGPGQFLFDLSVTREFRFGAGETRRRVLRPTIEIDNVFNSTVFSFGAAFINATDPQNTFLVPQRTLRPRLVRVGVRFDW